jgi:hypothetical protein
MTAYRHPVLCLLWVVMSALVWLAPAGVHARPLTAFDLTIAGIDLAAGSALSLKEMQQRGIVVDQANFAVLNFTAAVGTLSDQVAKGAAGTALAGGVW